MYMKRSFYILGALALASLMACNKEAEQAVTPSPYFDAETNTVKTDFVLNVSTNTGKDTKTTAEFVQVDSDFLGMDNVHVLSYNLPYSSEEGGHFLYKPRWYNPDTKEVEVVPASRDFNLGTLFSAKSVTEMNASRSVELALPLGTNAVVLYGKALKTYSDDLQGVATAAGDPNDLTTLTFSLKSRLASTAAYDAGAYFFTRMLTYFLTAGVVNEATFWTDAPIASKDKSYKFWWPLPSDEVAAQLATAFPNPVDGNKMTIAGIEYVYYAGELSWKQLGRMYDYEYDDTPATKSDEIVKTNNGTKVALSPLGEILGNAYQELTTIRTAPGLHEIRAGAATAILRTMRDLYTVVERGAGATPTTWEEQIARLLAKEIETRMRLFFAEGTDGTIDFIKGADGQFDIARLLEVLSTCTSTSDWDSNSSVLLANFTDAAAKGTTYDSGRKYFYSETNEGFPLNVGLPKGAACLICNVSADIKKVDTFAYSTEIPAYGMGEVTFPITSYRYPAELMYFGNSPVRVSKKEMKSSDYPSTVSQWNSDASWTGWESDDASVRSDTRSVAMINNINYGTALLASTVKYGNTVLKDNNKALHPLEEDQTIDITKFTDEKQGFFVTGIIVGGVADVMGWEFVRKPSNTDYSGVTIDADGKFSGLSFTGNAFDKMIYDKCPNPIKVTTNTEPIYTMVWDNYDHTKAADKQSDVYVGVELVNNTNMDLWGELNLIRKGGTFYLVGKMDLATAVATARAGEGHQDDFKDLSRNHYCYPPFNLETGKTISAPRVFMQDYMTKANLILGENALKHAYVTVPDLRSSQISLGVSIDMHWESGLAFDVVLGGE